MRHSLRPVAVRRLSATSAPNGFHRGLRHTAKLLFTRLRALVWPSLPVVLNVEAPCSGSVIPGLLVTTQTGLFYLFGDHAVQLLQGRFFGVCRFGDSWIAYHEAASGYGQLISFQIREARVYNVGLVRRGMPPGVHQVDYDGQQVYVCDTTNNRLLMLQPDRLSGAAKVFYPVGRAYRGEPGYVHLNSVYSAGEDLFLVLHNDSFRTGRQSELYVSGRDCRRRVSLGAWCAHNFAVWKGQGVICNSGAGTVRVGRTGTIHLGYFTRGLAISEDVAYVGASRFAPRGARDKHDGFVFAVDLNKREVLGVSELPHVGSVYEVRLVDGLDLGSSLFANNSRVSLSAISLPTEVVDVIDDAILRRCG